MTSDSGATLPAKLGESWPVNAALFARTGALSAAFDPKDVSGTVTLAAVKPAGGVPCLEVRWQLAARHGLAVIGDDELQPFRGLGG